MRAHPATGTRPPGLSPASAWLVDLHRRDLLAGVAREDGEAFAALRGIRTVAELDRIGFWTRLDAAALTSPAESCVDWRALP